MKTRTLILALFFFIVSCDKENDSRSYINSDGQGGSLATFALYGNYLYVVDDVNLSVFSIVNPEAPSFIRRVTVGFNIETLFGFKDYLFIGSQEGMYIYSLADPEQPSQLSRVSHFRSCDPVVANDTVSFVTLHSNIRCVGTLNQMEIYDIRDITKPKLLNTLAMTAPKGLGLYKDYVIVCDDSIKIFNIRNVQNPIKVNTINREAFDVIVKGNNLIAIGEKGIYQYELLTRADTLDYISLSSIDL